jgi:hypothetical protein
VQAFASLGKNQASYLADSVDLVPEKRCTPIAIPKISGAHSHFGPELLGALLYV